MPPKGILSDEDRAKYPQYRPRFDHQLAVAMLDDGMTPKEIADFFGVTDGAVSRLRLSREERYLKTYEVAQRAKDLCPHCLLRKKVRRSGACAPCRAWLKTTLMVVQDADGLWWPKQWCATCQQWKYLSEFPRSRVERLGRHKTCRPCGTANRRDYRHRTAEPCEICGAPRASDREKAAGARARGNRIWPFCAKCLRWSDDPRAEEARREIRAKSSSTWGRRGSGSDS